jgi:hypothetical protein
LAESQNRLIDNGLLVTIPVSRQEVDNLNTVWLRLKLKGRKTGGKNTGRNVNNMCQLAIPVPNKVL